MNRLLAQKIGMNSFSLVFGVTVYIFFSVLYSAHLHYHEQFQLFLFDSMYFKERLAVPGGLADYIGEFLTQFFYNSWLGAAIITLLLCILQQLVWQVAKYFKKAENFYPITFLPSITVWVFFCDENALMSILVALIVSLLITCFFRSIYNYKLRVLYGIFFTIALYWFIGPAFFIFVIITSLQEFLLGRKRKDLSSVMLGSGMLLLSTLIPLVVQRWISYPLVNLFVGIGYYRFPAVMPYVEIVVLTMPLITLLFFICQPLHPFNNSRVFITSQVVILVLVTFSTVWFSMNLDKEEAMHYDYLVRKKKWDRIIQIAEKKPPTSPFNVTCLNLALGKTGQLGERMFEFYQNGIEGLLPVFQRDFTSPLPASEAYYHLGMINTAQRFTFEAMEAIPNFRKSTRCYMRLTETNIINGEYEVARKYINALSKTLFYRRWALKAKEYLYNDKKVDHHPEWGWLRKIRYEEDFLFSAKETDIMLGKLVQHNKANKLAFEYMLAYVLEQKDIEKFLKYYPLGREMNYQAIPKSYQEVLVYVWTQKNGSLDGMPWTISPVVKERVREFAHIYMNQSNSEEILRNRFGNSYWYYLLFKNMNAQ